MSEDEIIERALNILEARLRKPEYVVKEPKSVSGYLKLHFKNLEHESFRAMFLDNRHGLIAFHELSRGTIDSASVFPREVVKAVLKFNAAAVIFAHNHPSGHCEPSEPDKAITKTLQSALALVDVRVLDHFIIGHSTYSFAEHGLI